ncbi:hypothetical protein CkaCkLH20_04599 [Colletotrichum karsti]|uniref:Uncharacterized protein n=1 Tax=Colletotrichum karsti TaxID=1095194 RepID=A0A9P6LLP8_9PEZI|nr:uncharacterized protein CkaCkLH20_04599 [Colletotrichum karsti]KAF9878023.1 hypothetical protein CkaCkLH20_04599 [Colletotrichum karsti]
MSALPTLRLPLSRLKGRITTIQTNAMIPTVRLVRVVPKRKASTQNAGFSSASPTSYLRANLAPALEACVQPLPSWSIRGGIAAFLLHGVEYEARKILLNAWEPLNGVKEMAQHKLISSVLTCDVCWAHERGVRYDVRHLARSNTASPCRLKDILVYRGL